MSENIENKDLENQNPEEISKTESVIGESFKKMDETLDGVMGIKGEETASEEPEKPEKTASEVPEKPEEPEKPEVPEVPEKPKVSKKTAPEKPEVPEVPEKPEIPEVPEKPKVPKKTASDDLEKIKKLIKVANNYSHLSCGRFLKAGINKKNLKLFYNEFVTYGVGDSHDMLVMNTLKKMFGTKK